tara:strand:+ start:398 stop:697 length:300 start_codon:yes stop_codon:yes gene_type:complete
MSHAADPIPLDYYIYYRVREPAVACERVRAMQTVIAARTGVHGRLMCRADDDETLMEVYPTVVDPDAFETALGETLAAHDIEALIAEGAGRHVERFRCV